jgi:hypothetical protein
MTMAHRLGTEEAQRRLKVKLSAIRDIYGRQVSDLHEEWHENTLSFGFKAMGMNVAGVIEVDNRDVRLSAQVPFAVVIFKGPIETRIRAELGNLLS